MRYRSFRRRQGLHPPPPHYFLTYSFTSSRPFVSGNAGQRRGQWVVCCELGDGHRAQAEEKRQQLGGRSRALLIQSVEGAVILC